MTRAPVDRSELASARAALLAGDLGHAVMHVSTELARDPTDPEALQLIDEVMARADDPLALAPADGAFFGLAAVRARMLLLRGKLAPALKLLLAVVRFRPQIAYLRWIPLDQLSAISDVSAISVELLEAVEAFPEEVAEDDPRRDNLERMLAIARALQQKDAAQPVLASTVVIALRKLGFVAEAVSVAEDFFARHPSWLAAITAANAQRAHGRVERAVACYEAALRLEPAQLSPLLDMGDAELEVGNFDTAAGAYSRALAREPTHAWAEPSHAFVRALFKRDPEACSRVFELARQGNQRAKDLARALSPLNVALEPPQELAARAAVDAIARIAADPEGGGPHAVRFDLPSPGPPSVMVAFELAMELLGRSCQLELVPERIPEPDPREPTGPARYLLWKYEGARPLKALPKPDPRIAADVARVAETELDIARWAEAAGCLGKRVGPGVAEDILATMIHPPAPPTGDLHPIVWLHRLQLAAAFVIAQLEDRWEGSARRDALISLVRGPADWTVGAGAVALAWVAARETEVRREAMEELRARLQQLARARESTSYRPALVAAALFVAEFDMAWWPEVWREWLRLPAAPPT